MTATDQMRAMLDQLMGTSRNGKFQIKSTLYFLTKHKAVAFMIKENN